MRGPRSTLFAIFLLTDRESRVRGLIASPHFVCAPNNGGLPPSASGMERSCGATAASMMRSSPRRRRPRRDTCCLEHRGKFLDNQAMGYAVERNGRLSMSCTDSSAELVQLDHALHPSHDGSSSSSSSSSAVVSEDGNESAPTTPSARAAPAASPPQSDSEAGGGKKEGRSGEFVAAEKVDFGAESVLGGMSSAVVGVVPLKRRADGRLLIDGQGLLNLCILIFAGLWAVHSVVTVDSSMWRGWTLQETLIRLPWDNWDSYEVGLLEHPIVTKTAINVGIYLLGDWLSQVNWGREEDVQLWEFDLQRTLRNGLIGAMFGPLVHYYYDFSDWILPPNVATNRPLKIILDQSIYFVSKCAVYISMVSLLRGDSLEETRDTVKGRLKGVVTTGWRFWPFVHVFTYFLIPPRHRVLWVNCVDLLWSSILAGLTSGTPPEETEEGGGGVSEDGGVTTSATMAVSKEEGQA